MLRGERWDKGEKMRAGRGWGRKGNTKSGGDAKDGHSKIS